MITPEDRKCIEALRDFLPLNDPWVTGKITWLLDLVERQEAELDETSMVLQSMAEIATGEWLTPLAELKARYGPIDVDSSGERVAKREELGRTKDGIS